MKVGRKEWEEKSSKLSSSFDINAVTGSISDDLLRRAKSAHDAMFSFDGSKAAGSGQQQQTYTSESKKVLFFSNVNTSITGVFCKEKRSWQPGTSDQVREPPTKKAKFLTGIYCFKCRKEGHFASDCKKQKKS